MTQAKKERLHYAVFSQLEWTLLQVCVSYPEFASLTQRGKKGRPRKKLERDTAKGESWRDKPTDGKLCSKESPLL